MKLCRTCGLEKPLSEFSAGNGLHGKYHRCKPCAKEFDKSRRTPERNRESNLRNHFGITSQEYSAVFAKQKGVCALCFQPTQGKFLDVDHSHNHLHSRVGQQGCKECIRGLLCNRCNMALGLLEVSPNLQNDLVRHYLSQRPFLS